LDIVHIRTPLIPGLYRFSISPRFIDFHHEQLKPVIHQQAVAYSIQMVLQSAAGTRGPGRKQAAIESPGSKLQGIKLFAVIVIFVNNLPFMRFPWKTL
jgi:hypothetical protein